MKSLIIVFKVRSLFTEICLYFFSLTLPMTLLFLFLNFTPWLALLFLKSRSTPSRGYGVCTHVRALLVVAAWRRLRKEAGLRSRQYLYNLSGSVASYELSVRCVLLRELDVF